MQKSLGLVPPRRKPYPYDGCRLEVAKLARSHHADIRFINENLTFKEEQKLEKIRDLIFSSTKRN